MDSCFQVRACTFPPAGNKCCGYRDIPNALLQGVSAVVCCTLPREYILHQTALPIRRGWRYLSNAAL